MRSATDWLGQAALHNRVRSCQRLARRAAALKMKLLGQTAAFRARCREAKALAAGRPGSATLEAAQFVAGPWRPARPWGARGIPPCEFSRH